jgi:hypothetical protein
MWNPTDGPVHLMEVLTPAGTERWFEELATLTDAGRFDEVSDRYGITWLRDSPWTERLRVKHGLD